MHARTISYIVWEPTMHDWQAVIGNLSVFCLVVISPSIITCKSTVCCKWFWGGLCYVL